MWREGRSGEGLVFDADDSLTLRRDEVWKWSQHLRFAA